MRKAIMVLLVVALMTGMLAIPALAAEPRATAAVASLDISGTTATCGLRAGANTTEDEMYAVIRLYRGSVPIKTWTTSGDGYILFSQDWTITKGYTYKMTVDLTVNGVDFPVDDVYRTA